MLCLSFIKRLYGILSVTALIFLYPVAAHAVFNEQVAIDARAVALANSCTADPPGLMSVHYNPAGLSLLDEGKTFSNGFGIPIIKRTGTFKANKDFKGFMNGTWGNDPTKWPNGPNHPATDPNSDHGGPDPLNGKSGTNTSGRFYVPFYKPIDFLFAANAGLAVREKDSRWTLAYANYAPFGGGIAHRNEGDPLKFGSKSFYSQHFIYAAPTASYMVSDTLSIGISVGMAQRAFGIETDLRSPNELIALTRVIGDATKDLNIPVVSQTTLPPPWLGGGLGPYEHAISFKVNTRDDFVPSVNFGLLWRPFNWLSYGFCYQSESVAELSGKFMWEYSEQFQRQVAWNGSTTMTMEGAGMLDLPSKAYPYQSGTVTVKETMPQRVQTGIMIRPINNLKLLLDVQYAGWARASKENRFSFDQKIQILRLAKMLGYQHGAQTLVLDRYMKDTWHWSAGLEYEVNSKLSLRCGYEKRPTSQQKSYMDQMMFIPDAELIGAGLGLKLPNGMKLDLGFGYLFGNHSIMNNSSTNFNSTDFTQMGNNFTGLDYYQKANIKVILLGVTMPLELQMEMLHHQQEMMKHAVHKIKGLFKKIMPFGKKEGEEKKEEETPGSNDSSDKEDEDFNAYLDKLSADYK